ncbi:MAG TPA: hypothetical protein VGG24_03695 [Paraburkholderia sp.]|jgi:hypothetical protein
MIIGTTMPWVDSYPQPGAALAVAALLRSTGPSVLEVRVDPNEPITTPDKLSA